MVKTREKAVAWRALKTQTMAAMVVFADKTHADNKEKRAKPVNEKKVK